MVSKTNEKDDTPLSSQRKDWNEDTAASRLTAWGLSD
jgi:hypothetical protein